MELPKNYDPSLFEAEIYATWEKKGYFKAQGDKAPEKPSFCIVMPPPNITGQLHMGHALDNTIQDTITRYKRMAGYDALWLPGTDHASIATELKVVEKLRSEGISKEQIGREKFLEHAFAWKDEYGGRIVKQLRRLGSSCDWSREAFTMDKNCSKAVRAVFKRLYDKGLIYKGKKIVNWCPSCRTALSDAEVEYDEKDGFLWHIRYPLTDGTGYLTVATTRPETMLGDTAVAVNPQDEKYKSIVGKTLTLPLVNKEIPVIADSYVEIGFGTGAVKITPAHDPNDFEVGLRHDLEVIDVMTDSALMNENAGKYEGLTSLECRKQIVNDLDEQGYLVKTEPYKHNVGSCYRCGTTAEPRVSEQWFVKMTPLAKPAIRAVRQRKTVFVPDRFSKIYYNWMENIRDWCISRSLWWGHRLPVYYCAACGEVHVTDKEAAPTKCTKCGGTAFTQEEAVLDTWFSSALWPFSTLGYPNMQSKDLSKFYPTDVLVTAYDIIFFWVARMIFSGIENMGQVPFAQVLIHGIVRDSQGRKMSKSLGNGIDPLILIDKFGADALRLSLITGIAPGTDIRFSEDKIEPQRNFLNKLWNASRFVMMNLEGKSIKDVSELTKITSAGKWILKKTDSCVRAVTRNLEKYELGLALARIYDFIWGDYCDWYIEL
ncbi:MAG: valine--tRNA ligase, partial [Christensenellaceae bacterium]|nr:valine--tRNA ligase [Christensenellaceae bacterium]